MTSQTFPRLQKPNLCVWFKIVEVSNRSFIINGSIRCDDISQRIISCATSYAILRLTMTSCSSLTDVRTPPSSEIKLRVERTKESVQGSIADTRHSGLARLLSKRSAELRPCLPPKWASSSVITSTHDGLMMMTMTMNLSSSSGVTEFVYDVYPSQWHAESAVEL